MESLEKYNKESDTMDIFELRRIIDDLSVGEQVRINDKQQPHVVTETECDDAALQLEGPYGASYELKYSQRETGLTSSKIGRIKRLEPIS